VVLRVVDEHKPMNVAEEIDRVRGWLADAESVAVLTGAGVSTDSGIPDFRGPKGLWTRNPEAEKMATLEIYVADPEVRKRSWLWRLETEESKTEPNRGHLALVDLERAGCLSTLVTQNVDGLHQAAGSDPARVVEIHGTLQEVECLDCGERAPMQRALDRVIAGEEDPACRSCGGILKSATISFGQGLVARDLQRAEHAARDCDLLLAIGSTLAVYPIAAMVPIAKQNGARIAILNGEPTEMDSIADTLLGGSISEILPQLVPR
jgi:NAD-dependent deacetylase